jgi:hypothetical protein
VVAGRGAPQPLLRNPRQRPSGGRTRAGKKSDQWIDRVISYVEHEPDEAFPDTARQPLRFYDAEGSWRIFTLLEALADGFGAWRVADVLGAPWLDLPVELTEDLLTWRWLAGIAERVRAKQNRSDDGTE